MEENTVVSPEGQDGVSQTETQEVAETKVEESQENSGSVIPASTKKTDKRGVGYTRKDKSSSKKADKLARKQRQINHKRATKKSRPTGSKKRK